MEIKAAALAGPVRSEFVSASASTASLHKISRSDTSGSVDGGTQVEGGYISPVIRFDQQARLAVMYFRDTETGETTGQIPPEKIVKEYRRNGGHALDDGSSSATLTDGGGLAGGATTASPVDGETAPVAAASGVATSASPTAVSVADSSSVSTETPSSGSSAGSFVSLTV